MRIMSERRFREELERAKFEVYQNERAGMETQEGRDMSECVVRMEMPKNCDACPCLDEYGDYPRCRISEEQRGYNFPIREKRMPLCPILCQLPEGHGRLVDKDEMLKKIENYHRYMTIGRESDPRCIIEDSPTIVPAEAERRET